MKILITNNSFVSRSGSELYAKEIGEKLLERGHTVAAYSNFLGDLAKEMNSAGIETVDNLSKLSWVPNIIHGQHHLEAMTAIANFPAVPVLYLNHGWRPWQEKPPLHPRIMQYAAVDTLTYNFALEKGVPENKLKLIHNFVDLGRFTQRGPLPAKPKKALVFSNYATESNYLPAVAEACEKAGIELDTLGASYGNLSENPEQLLKNYDLVFAKGRCSLETLASGTALIICDELGVGPLVTTRNMEQLRDQNFGIAAIYSQIDPEVIYQEIQNYNVADAALVTEKLREVIGIDTAIEELEGLYQEAIANFQKTPIDNKEESQALSTYLYNLSLFIKESEIEHLKRARVLVENNRTIAQKDNELHQLKEQINHFHEHLAKIMREFELVINSRTWRLRSKLVELKSAFSRIAKRNN